MRLWLLCAVAVAALALAVAGADHGDSRMVARGREVGCARRGVEPGITGPGMRGAPREGGRHSLARLWPRGKRSVPSGLPRHRTLPERPEQIPGSSFSSLPVAVRTGSAFPAPRGIAQPERIPRGWRAGSGEDTAGRAFPSTPAPWAAPCAARIPGPGLRQIPIQPFPPQGRRRPHRPCSGCFSVLSEVSRAAGMRECGMWECGMRDAGAGAGGGGSHTRVCPAGVAVDALEFP